MDNEIERKEGWPVYSLQDFRGDAPYIEIYGLRNNRFEMEGHREVIAANAKDVGYRGFTKRLKAYFEMQDRMRATVLSDNSTEFTGQPMTLRTGMWECDDDGVFLSDGRGNEITACPHPIMPVARLADIDTGLEKIVLAFSRNGRWQTKAFDRSVVSSAAKITQIADHGIMVTSENARYLIQYLSETEALNEDRIEIKRCISRCGWISDKEFSPYCEDVLVEAATFKSLYESIEQTGTLDRWKEAVSVIRTEDNIPARVVLASSFASVLVAHCSNQPFIVHLWGTKSGTGKSVAAFAAASAWGYPDIGRYVRTFNSTIVAKELTSNFLNSLPLVLDELQLQKDRRTFDNTIYALAEGGGRDRGNKFGGVNKLTSWRNCIITSGEMPITNDSSGGGSVNRVINIGCDDRELISKEDASVLMDRLRANHGTAGRKFVKELLDPEVMSLAKGLYKTFTKELSGMPDLAGKQINSAATILTADSVLSEYIFDDELVIPVEAMAGYLATNEDIDQNEKAFEWLRGWIAQSRQFFLHDDLRPLKTVGVVTTWHICIIKSIFDEECRSAGYSPESLLIWMIGKGYVEADGKRKTKVVSINGHSCRCVAVIRAKYEEKAEIDEEPEYNKAPIW
jgi:hypothetical protein